MKHILLWKKVQRNSFSFAVDFFFFLWRYAKIDFTAFNFFGHIVYHLATNKIKIKRTLNFASKIQGGKQRFCTAYAVQIAC